jgi:hypothetical protein
MSHALTAEWPSSPPPADPNAEALAFLAVLRRSVETALRARRALLGELLAARHDPASALERAGHASRRCVRAFDDTLGRLTRTRVPPIAVDCARELQQWLESHVEACDLLSRAALAHDRDDFAHAIRCLASSAPHASCFNTARDRLVRQLVTQRASAN